MVDTAVKPIIALCLRIIGAIAAFSISRWVLQEAVMVYQRQITSWSLQTAKIHTLTASLDLRVSLPLSLPGLPVEQAYREILRDHLQPSRSDKVTGTFLTAIGCLRNSVQCQRLCRHCSRPYPNMSPDQTRRQTKRHQRVSGPSEASPGTANHG